MADPKNLIVASVIVMLVVAAGAYYVGTITQQPSPPVIKENVIQIMTKAGNFSKFLQALNTTGLTTILKGSGPFTVFAPTDAAFTKIPTADLSTLMADKARLTDMLLYHIVSGRFTSNELSNGTLNSLLSEQGSYLYLTNTGIENAHFVVQDIGFSTSDSVVQSIDTVLNVPLRLLVVSVSDMNLRNISPASYEMWVINETSVSSLGKFSVDDSGLMHTAHSGGIDNTFHTEGDFNDASGFFVSVEAVGDYDFIPSGTTILNGSVNSSYFPVDIKVNFGFPVNLTNASGEYILATPTNSPNVNSTSGIWFYDPSGPKASLTLPALPDGWTYAGWVYVDAPTLDKSAKKEMPITIGRFETATGFDNMTTYSWVQPPPQYPGEDFLQDSSTANGQVQLMNLGYPLMNVSFPLNLADGKSSVVITIQPNRYGEDPTGPGPFFIQLLSANIPQGAEDHKLYAMVLVPSTIPTATADLTTHD